MTFGILEYLDVSNNIVSGGLPSFARASHLNTVNMSGNALNGSLPSDPSWYGTVNVLNIGGNEFVGTVPTTLLWSSYVQNRTLIASGNRLTGVPLGPHDDDSIFPLRSLDLSNNNMFGELPSIFCEGSPFESLVLSYQSLSGRVPGCLANVSLAYLDLSNNFFVGDIPSEFVQMSSLTFLSLARNNLDGALPVGLIAGLRAAAMMDVSQNFLNGTLPVSEIVASQRTALDVSGNCGLVWPTSYDCQSKGCQLTCCRITLPCALTTRVCNLLPQLPATRCSYALPPAPLAVSAKSLASAGSLRVQWSAPPMVHARFCQFTNYFVRVVPPGGGTFNTSVIATEFEANVTRLPTGVILTVSVAAVNCAGVGEWSYPTSAVAVSRPGVPSDIVASGLNSGAALEWDAPDFSGLKIDSFMVQAAEVDGTVRAPISVPSTGACHANFTMMGLILDALYKFRVCVNCADAAYCPGPWSDWAGPVRTFVAPSLIDQLVSSRTVIAGVCSAVLLYCALLLANRKWKGRDFTALFLLVSVSFHLGSSAFMGVKLVRTTDARVQTIVFFATLALAAAWSAVRVAVFLRRSLHVPTPPHPHMLTFDEWCAKYRTWVSSFCFVSCFQLSILSVLRSRAIGQIDGPFSAPMDPKLWSELQFHATATSLLRGLSTLIIIVVTYRTDEYFLLSVMSGLVSSIGILGYSIVTLLVDTAVRASTYNRAKQLRQGALHAPLLDTSSEVGMEMLSEPAHAAAPSGQLAPPRSGRGHRNVAFAALLARVAALDGELASDLHAAIASGVVPRARPRRHMQQG